MRLAEPHVSFFMSPMHHTSGQPASQSEIPAFDGEIPVSWSVSGK